MRRPRVSHQIVRTAAGRRVARNRLTSFSSVWFSANARDLPLEHVAPFAEVAVCPCG